MKIDEIIFKMAEPVSNDLGYELIDVEFVKEAQKRYLRIYIDKPNGVTIDDCQIMSERMSQILDSKDPIKEAYIFEVSSPGLERVLKKDRDYHRYRGELIDIKLYKALNGSKMFQGVLKDFDKENIYLEMDGKSQDLARKDIAVAKRVFIFNGRT